MIELEDLNLLHMPRLPLEHKSLLPNEPGLYFVFTPEELLYIGSTEKSLRKRLSAKHHRHYHFSKYHPVLVGYVVLNDDLIPSMGRFCIRSLEAKAIAVFRPILNGKKVIKSLGDDWVPESEEELEEMIGALKKNRATPRQINDLKNRLKVKR